MSRSERFGRSARRADGAASHPALNWTLGIAQLAMMSIFVAYFVSAQANAVAYLAGSRHPIVGGTTPPLPLHSTGAAATDITIGLVIEALATIDVLIAVLFSRAAIRDMIERHRSRVKAQD